MESVATKSMEWSNRELLEATADPNISVTAIAEEVPTVTVATVVGVSVAVILIIIIVFGLGVLIDWRQQKILQKKILQVKRLQKNFCRTNVNIETEGVSIAGNMEEPDMSAPPAATLRNIP